MCIIWSISTLIVERLNSDGACELCQPYRPLNSILRLHIRIALIINNLHILKPYLPLTFSAQNPDDQGRLQSA